MVVIVKHDFNIQRIIDHIKTDTELFDSGATEGKLREVIFGDPRNNDKRTITQRPAIYVTTGDDIQLTRYAWGLGVPNNQHQITVVYEIGLLTQTRESTERAQKLLYTLMTKLEARLAADPLFKSVINPPTIGTDPIFTRSIVNKIPWDKQSRGTQNTAVKYILAATIGSAYSINIPTIGDVILLSKPNNLEGVVTSENREQATTNRTLTENGEFGSLYVEYESTVALDNSIRAKFGVEENITLTELGVNRIINVKYIDLNPTAQFDQISRSVLHMEIVKA